MTITANLHTSTPFHTLSRRVWKHPSTHFHTTTPLGGVGVWCGVQSGGAGGVLVETRCGRGVEGFRT